MASIRRSASSADRIYSETFRMLSVWGLLAAVPMLLEPCFGSELALLGAFLAATAVVLAAPAVARVPAARARRPGPAAPFFSLGGLAGSFAITAGVAEFAGLAAGDGWLPPDTPAGSRALVRWAAVVLVAPVFEELLYRERLLGAFQPAVGGIPAVLLTSLLFAIPHLQPSLAAAAFAVGVALGLVRLRSGSIALCIGIHAGLNAASLASGLPSPRLLLRGAALVFASVGVAAAAAAGEVRWSGTLAINFLASGLPAIAIPGSGVATVNGGGGAFPLNSLRLAGGISGSTVVAVTDPDVTVTLENIRLSAALGTGTLAPFTPSALPSQPQLSRNALPVPGAARLCFLSPDCGSALTLPFTTARGGKGLGIGGAWTANGFGSPSISVEAAPWTLRTASAIFTTASGAEVGVPTAGWVHGPFSFAASAALTDGSASLVTPMRFQYSGSRPIPAFARLTLRFAPEPGRLSLLAAGIAGLLAIGRVRPPPGPAGSRPCNPSAIPSSDAASPCFSPPHSRSSAASSSDP